MIKFKNERQIEGIRRSCRLLASVLDAAEALIVAGAVPREIDAAVQSMIEDAGGRPAFLGYHGFPASLCFSVNAAVIHGIPGDTPLAEGDIVSMDCGIELEGFFSDSARTIAVGRVPEEIRTLMKTAEESLYLGIEAARPGNRLKDISRAIYDHNHARGYGLVRPYGGHGVGLALHEDPHISNFIGRGPNPRLKPGMVIAIEPMVNLGGDDIIVLDDDWTVVTADSSVSVHYEHTVAITPEGPEILTAGRNFHA